MKVELTPGKLHGEISVIPSKSICHRLLICAALSENPSHLVLDHPSEDLCATIGCLKALGTEIWAEDSGFWIQTKQFSVQGPCFCGESGSTLRFLLPLAGALGLSAEFRMGKRLSQRPMVVFLEELSRHGLHIQQNQPDRLQISGKLEPGIYRLPGNISSQYISGLRMALPLLDGASEIQILGTLESAPYVELTRDVLKKFGVDHAEQISPSVFHSPGRLIPEGDWSNGAFWHCANALGSSISVQGLSPDSLQGDRAICDLLPKLGNNLEVDVSSIPDLVPILALAATQAPGSTRFTHGSRLRLKESDRLATTCGLIRGLGGTAEETADGLRISHSVLTGGRVSACGDHRIAMTAAIAGTLCPVILDGAEAVAKSDTDFWESYRKLGGNWKEVQP